MKSYHGLWLCSHQHSGLSLRCRIQCAEGCAPSRSLMSPTTRHLDLRGPHPAQAKSQDDLGPQADRRGGELGADEGDERLEVGQPVSRVGRLGPCAGWAEVAGIAVLRASRCSGAAEPRPRSAHRAITTAARPRIVLLASRAGEFRSRRPVQHSLSGSYRPAARRGGRPTTSEQILAPGDGRRVRPPRPQNRATTSRAHSPCEDAESCQQIRGWASRAVEHQQVGVLPAPTRARHRARADLRDAGGGTHGG